MLKTLFKIFILFLFTSCALTDNMYNYRKESAKIEYPYWEKHNRANRLAEAKAALKQSREIRSEERKDERLNNKILRILNKIK